MDPVTTTPPVAPVAAPPTAETIAAAVQAGLQAHQASVQSAPKEMTPEERNQYLQVFDPNADGFVDSFVSAITDTEATPESRLKVIEHFRDGVTNQAVRGAQLLIEQQIGAFRQEFAPVLAATQKQQGDELWAQFAKAHPDLKDQRQIVDMVSIQLQSAGFRPKDLNEAFTRAAETTRTVISQVTGKPVVTPATQPAPNAMPRMQTTNTLPSGGNATPDGPAAPGVASFFLKRKR